MRNDFIDDTNWFLVANAVLLAVLMLAALYEFLKNRNKNKPKPNQKHHVILRSRHRS